jgi:hypothetical protein
VQIINRTENFLHVFRGLQLRIVYTFHDIVKQIPTLSNLRYNVNVFLVLIGLIHLDYVRVVNDS